MSITATSTQYAQSLTRFFDSRPEDFFRSGPTFSDFAGPIVPEMLSMMQFLRSVYEPLVVSQELTHLSQTAINALIGQLQSVNNTYSQLTNSRDQSSYQNFAAALDQFAHHTRMFGIPYLAAGGTHIENQRQALQEQLQLLGKNVAEVEDLKADVRTLITPAIAGSLSESFRQRRDSIYKGRMLWLFACVALGVFAVYVAFDFAKTMTELLAQQGGTKPNSTEQFWTILAVRTVVLVPAFAAFGFAFAQYRKEREFEEEYAHKAAVANTLPNYGDLAREQGVRDKLVTAATSVIFISPSEQARKVETSNVMLGSLKEVVDSLSKAVGRK